MQTSPGRGQGGRGPDVRLGSERPGPIKSTPATQRLDAIEVFCVAASADERSLRRRIHRAQGAATAAATQSAHWRARAYFWSAAQLAGDWQFKPANAEDLKEIINGISFLFLAARLIERVETPDA